MDEYQRTKGEAIRLALVLAATLVPEEDRDTPPRTFADALLVAVQLRGVLEELVNHAGVKS